MALRTPLSVTPHLYMGDSTGRPLDKGVVYFGEQDKDPEFYPINLFSDDALTKPLAQPVHTKGGYLYDKGDMVEPHAKELIYSVKVLDSYGRKVFYKGAMMRNSWNDDVIEQINTAIIGSADAARQVAIDITNDAINNTAVEGGVLADTFVTVTAKEIGSTPRNLRDVINDRVSIKDFGAKGDGSNATAAICLAVATGKPVWLPKGDYLVDCIGYDCKGVDVILIGEEGARIILGAPTTNFIFNIANCNNVITKNIEIVNTSTNNLAKQIFRVISTTPSVNKVIRTEGCEFHGAIRLLWSGGSVSDTEVMVKIESLVHTNNKIYNNVTGHLRLNNVVVTNAEFTYNRIYNLSRTIFQIGIINGAVLSDVYMSGTSIVCTDNSVHNDIDFWCDVPGADEAAYDYYCLLLSEANSVKYLRNTFDGVKANGKNLPLYDSYLTGRYITSKDNTYRNCGNFHAVNNNCAFIKGKGDTIGSKTNIKTWQNNSYIIEQDWLTAIGETSVQHCIHSVGVVNAGNVTISGCTFQFDTLRGSDRDYAEFIGFYDNKIQARNTVGNGSVVRILPLDNGESNMVIKNNTLYVSKHAMSDAMYFYISQSPNFFNSFTYTNNVINCASENVVTGEMFSLNTKELNYSDNSCTFYTGRILYGVVSVQTVGTNNISVAKGDGDSKGLIVSNTLSSVGSGRLTYSTFGRTPLTTQIGIHPSGEIIAPIEDADFRITASFDTLSGKKDIVMLYSLTLEDGVVMLSATDSLGVAYKQPLLVPSGTSIIIEHEETLVDEFKITPRLYNNEFGAYLMLNGLPETVLSMTVERLGISRS